MMQLPPATCVLVAAGFDWLEVLLPFLFVAFWILSQVFAVFRRLGGGQPPGEARKPPPLPRFEPPREQRRLPDGDAADPRSDLEKQIAEFLRDVNGEKPRRPAAGPTVVRDAAAETRPHSPRRPGRTEAERRGPQGQRVVPSSRAEHERAAQQPPAAARKPAVPPAGTVAGAERVSKEREETNVSVARHVQDAFSRELTHLRGTLTGDESQGGTVPTRKPTPAEELVHLLRNPATIRQVILLREVIDRPVDRW